MAGGLPLPLTGQVAIPESFDPGCQLAAPVLELPPMVFPKLLGGSGLSPLE